MTPLNFATWTDDTPLTAETMNREVRDVLDYLTCLPAARVCAEIIPQTEAGAVVRATFLTARNPRAWHTYDSTGGLVTGQPDRLTVPEDGLYDIHASAQVEAATETALTFAEAGIVLNSTSSAMLAFAPARFALGRRTSAAWRGTSTLRLPLRAGDYLTLHLMGVGAPWRLDSDLGRATTHMSLTRVGDSPA